MFRTGCLLVAMVLGTAVPAQSVRITGARTGHALDFAALESASTDVAGMGSDVPGLALKKMGLARLHAGDGPGFAARTFMDTAWSRADATDSLPPGVQWIRIRFQPDATLKGRTLALNLPTGHAPKVFLNGDTLVHASAPAMPPQDAAPAPPFLVPFTLHCDGAPEVLAIRLQDADADAVADFLKSASIHPADMAYRFQQVMVQYGVFIGVNLIILVLALVIWRSEPRERRWLYLALLSAIYMLDTFLEAGCSQEALGFAASTVQTLHSLQIILTPWPFYLLIRTLGSLHGRVDPRRKRWYNIAVAVATLACAAIAAARRLAGPGPVEHIAVSDFSSPGVVALLMLGIILALLWVAVMAWFILEVVRLGMKLMRTPGHARWVGVGALASSVVAFLFNLTGDTGVLGEGLSKALTTLAGYFSGIGVPVSVALFLAVRTAHHGRLVARQRDELDAEVKHRTAELTHEKERTEELLLNILPAEVAEELKNTGTAQARHFDQVSVLFTDFQGFTRLSSNLSPEALLKELNACFEAFDAIITRRGIEKIKTIGDAYMCASGLSTSGKDAPANLVLAALEMQEFLAARKRQREAAGQPGFSMRAGIHTGPVVAGIVGVKKFQYDIWGDTVNTASRMESNGEPGKVNISGATYALVKDVEEVNGERPMVNGEILDPHSPAIHSHSPAFLFTPRGKVEVKGKGALEMYFVRRGPDPA